jgi:hypothetical protein
MKFDVNKKEIKVLLDLFGEIKVYDIFGKANVKMILNQKTFHADQMSFNRDKIYIIKKYNTFFKLSKVNDFFLNESDNSDRNYAFLNLYNTYNKYSPENTVENIFNQLKDEDVEIYVFDSFHKFTKWYALNR